MTNSMHAYNIFPWESNPLKTPFLACINMMNRDVLQLLCSTEHDLQLNNLSLYSLRSFESDLVNLCLYVAPISLHNS